MKKSGPKFGPIRVNIQLGKRGLYYGTSRNLKGLLIAESSAALVREKAPQAIADLYLAAGIDELDVLHVDHDTWTTRPAAVRP